MIKLKNNHERLQDIEARLDRLEEDVEKCMFCDQLTDEETIEHDDGVAGKGIAHPSCINSIKHHGKV